MSLHTELDIFKASYDLLGVADDLVRNIPRAHKPYLGRKIFDECTEVVAAIPLANAERGAGKVPHINRLLQRLEVTKTLFRLCVDKRYISRDQFARTIPLTTSIGRQANGWKKSSASLPLRLNEEWTGRFEHSAAWVKRAVRTVRGVWIPA